MREAPPVTSEPTLLSTTLGGGGGFLFCWSDRLCGSTDADLDRVMGSFDGDGPARRGNLEGAAPGTSVFGGSEAGVGGGGRGGGGGGRRFWAAFGSDTCFCKFYAGTLTKQKNTEFD